MPVEHFQMIVQHEQERSAQPAHGRARPSSAKETPRGQVLLPPGALARRATSSMSSKEAHRRSMSSLKPLPDGPAPGRGPASAWDRGRFGL